MSVGLIWRIVAAALMLFATAPAVAAPTALETAAVGRLVCRSGGTVAEASAWVVASADVVVTAAHPLFAGGRAADPHQCVFRLHAPDGSVVEAARVEAIASPWQDARRRGDNSWDYAVLRLERPVSARPLRLVARSWHVTGGPVRLASFPADGAHRLQLTRGEARAFPLGAVEDEAAGRRVSEPARLFASDAPSAGGSSGGVYYAAGSQDVAGLHVGRICTGGVQQECFGFGLRIGADLLATVAEMAGRSRSGGDSFAMVTP